MIQSLLLLFVLIGNGTDSPLHKTELTGIKCIVSGKAINPDCSSRYLKGEVYFDCNASKLKYEADRKKFAIRANHQLVVTQQYWQANCPIRHKPVAESTEAKTQLAGAVIRFHCKHCQKKMMADLDQSKQIELVFSSPNFEKTFQPRPTESQR